ncbi:MAG: glycerol-3-phosphate 1-O-acyltransferase PlsY [Candidatus Omnitrophota bacterium]|nr:MAG: glycerol-3-phosphate 1-O-acyltransferase PlsY [Candidatus Omnitrophota bacterium]
MTECLLLLLSFLLGSIPFGYLVARAVKGIDIREFGSGNIGATNVVRIVGKKWGLLVFALDFFKGFIPPLAVKIILAQPQNYIFILAAFLAVCGHNWTPFLKFKGGKGVATTVGAVGGLSFVFVNLWLVFFLSILVWFIVFRLTRYVSVASLFAAGMFFILCFMFSLPFEVKMLSGILFLFILVRHKENIKGLLQNKEHRF